jgi:dienelactone hydrolase
VLALAVAIGSVPACASTPPPAVVAIAVTGNPADSDQPFDVLIAGVTPGATIDLAMTSTDAHGVAWSSRATYAAGSSGRLDLATDAPRSGSYAGASGTGLLWSMKPAGGADPYFWKQAGSLTFTVTVTVGGQPAGSTHFERRFGPHPLAITSETLAAPGFVGTYFAPTSGGAHTAVLYLGGSEGGIPYGLPPQHLAADGYPTLALAYFGEPGLPATLDKVPLEYFARALTWLAAQPGVDPAKLVVSGDSRGSEAALLLATEFPQLVHGVIASVPSNVAVCANPVCSDPAWTLRDAPIPYTRQFDTPAPTDTPAAVIAVETAHAPMLLDCAGSDKVWTSCPYANAIVARLDAHGYPYPHELDAYPDAGHGLGGLLPYEPGFDLSAGKSAGRTPDANQRATQLLWPRVLAFLAAV